MMVRRGGFPWCASESLVEHQGAAGPSMKHTGRHICWRMWYRHATVDVDAAQVMDGFWHGLGGREVRWPVVDADRVLLWP